MNIILLLFTTINDLHNSLAVIITTNIVLDTHTKGMKLYVLNLNPGGKQPTHGKELLMGNIHLFFNKYNELQTGVKTKMPITRKMLTIYSMKGACHYTYKLFACNLPSYYVSCSIRAFCVVIQAPNSFPGHKKHGI